MELCGITYNTQYKKKHTHPEKQCMLGTVECHSFGCKAMSHRLDNSGYKNSNLKRPPHTHTHTSTRFHHMPHTLIWIVPWAFPSLSPLQVQHEPRYPSWLPSLSSWLHQHHVWFPGHSGPEASLWHSYCDSLCEEGEVWCVGVCGVIRDTSDISHTYTYIQTW